MADKNTIQMQEDIGEVYGEGTMDDPSYHNYFFFIILYGQAYQSKLIIVKSTH